MTEEKDNPYRNAYIGVDPAPGWQSPPINTDAEIKRLKQVGMVPVDANGEPIAEEPESAAEESVADEAAVEGDGTEQPVEAPVVEPAPEGDNGGPIEPAPLL